MTNSQIRLANANKAEHPAQFDGVRAAMIVKEIERGENPRSKDEQIAVLRKAVAYLFELIGTLHEGEINNAEFVAYHESVEAIKLKVDRMLEGKNEA